MLGAGIKMVTTKNNAFINLTLHEISAPFSISGQHPCILKSSIQNYCVEDKIWAATLYIVLNISIYILNFWLNQTEKL